MHTNFVGHLWEWGSLQWNLSGINIIKSSFILYTQKTIEIRKKKLFCEKRCWKTCYLKIESEKINNIQQRIDCLGWEFGTYRWLFVLLSSLHLRIIQKKKKKKVSNTYLRMKLTDLFHNHFTNFITQQWALFLDVAVQTPIQYFVLGQ